MFILSYSKQGHQSLKKSYLFSHHHVSVIKGSCYQCKTLFYSKIIFHSATHSISTDRNNGFKTYFYFLLC